MKSADLENAAQRRATLAGRWTPLIFYALIVISWFVEGIQAGLADRLWLVAFTLPAPVAYLLCVRTKRE